jgi:hypothetical protein
VPRYDKVFYGFCTCICYSCVHLCLYVLEGTFLCLCGFAFFFVLVLWVGCGTLHGIVWRFWYFEWTFTVLLPRNGSICMHLCSQVACAFVLFAALSSNVLIVSGDRYFRDNG